VASRRAPAPIVIDICAAFAGSPRSCSGGMYGSVPAAACESVKSGSSLRRWPQRIANKIQYLRPPFSNGIFAGFSLDARCRARAPLPTRGNLHSQGNHSFSGSVPLVAGPQVFSPERTPSQESPSALRAELVDRLDIWMVQLGQGQASLRKCLRAVSSLRVPAAKPSVPHHGRAAHPGAVHTPIPRRLLFPGCGSGRVFAIWEDLLVTTMLGPHNWQVNAPS